MKIFQRQIKLMNSIWGLKINITSCKCDRFTNKTGALFCLDCHNKIGLTFATLLHSFQLFSRNKVAPDSKKY
jgi:hypothetical protein